VLGRFSLTSLGKGLRDGLRKRRKVGEEKPDRLTRALLIILPIAALALAVYFDWTIDVPQDLLAGIALLIGAELAAFTQLAAWRERLNQRNLGKEAVRRRALDEAVAHVLVSTLIATLTAALLVAISVLGLDKESGPIALWAARILSAGVLGLLTYLGLTLWIVVNLLWDAYLDANGSLKP
jgi:hypothetical protein